TRMFAVMRKEFIQLTRDTTSLRIIIIMPIIMMIMFGYVIDTDVKSTPTAVAIQDNGLPARELFEQFRATGYFDFVRYVHSAAEVGKLIEDGTVKAGLIIPSDYSEHVNRGETAQVQVLIDGSDPLVSRTSLTTAEMLGQLTSTRILTQKLSRVGGGALSVDPPVEVRARVWYNPEMESVKFNMPGLVGIVLQNITVILIAAALVKERERGTMEQLIVTPVTSAELILGKMIPYVGLAVIDVTMVLLISVFWFGMKIAGSLLVLSFNALIFLLGSLGLGLFVSTISENHVQANQWSQLILLPSVLLSGYMFPRENMPMVLRMIGLGIPLTYFLQILRGVILKGAGQKILWRQTAALAIYAVCILSLAVSRLKKRLD
ncbi:MAG: ABC transporter permease, partial [Bacillota bacterium]|nr:ABC transporter permease [Bacillota bacterium]